MNASRSCDATLPECRPGRVHNWAVALVALLALVVIGSIVAACGGDAVGSGASGSSPAGSATRIPATTQPGPDTPLVVDARLLRYLPASVAGIAMQPAAESAAGMIGDAELAKSASALAVGIVVAAGDSRGDDLAVSTVIQLRPGVDNDQFYAAEPGFSLASNDTVSSSRSITVCRRRAPIFSVRSLT